MRKGIRLNSTSKREKGSHLNHIVEDYRQPIGYSAVFWKKKNCPGESGDAADRKRITIHAEVKRKYDIDVTTHSGREIIIWSDGRTSSFARSIGTPWLHLSQQQSGNNDRNIVLGSQDSLTKRFVHGTTRTQALDLKTLGIYTGGLWMPGIFSNVRGIRQPMNVRDGKSRLR